jgi:hypothetical protein
MPNYGRLTEHKGMQEGIQYDLKAGMPVDNQSYRQAAGTQLVDVNFNERNKTAGRQTGNQRYIQ